MRNVVYARGGGVNAAAVGIAWSSLSANGCVSFTCAAPSRTGRVLLLKSGRGTVCLSRAMRSLRYSSRVQFRSASSRIAPHSSGNDNARDRGAGKHGYHYKRPSSEVSHLVDTRNP